MKNILAKLLPAITCVLFLFACTENNKTPFEADFRVIPLPDSIEKIDSESFKLDKNTKIVYPQGDEDQKRNADFLISYLKQITALNLSATSESLTENVIILSSDYKSDIAESYELTVNQNTIIINGMDAAGTFHGIQTLRKSLSEATNKNEISFPAVEIKDSPRFLYRGMHLDVARHMFDVNAVKTYIDILALHNINYFHWHLTDDQGWRIEIKSRPKLSEISSMRAQTVIGKNTGEYDGKPYGGYYTQEEVKDIIQYAAERFITIIPEVDLPGHMVAALAAYPELGCTGGPYEVIQEWGVFEDVLCAGNDEIFTFLEDVYTEIIDLFPSEYINVGGDECPKSRWEECPKCQARINELGLKDDAHHTAEEYLQSYVIQRMEKFINSKGRRVIGWDEILEGGIAPNATILSWRGIEGGIVAAKQQHDVIMVPTSHFYFDYYQSEDIKNEPFGIGGYVPVEKVYSFNPLPEELTVDEQKYIIGVQANIWCEYVKSEQHLQHMVLPRMAALCEVQWTKEENKDYSDFLIRVSKLAKLYDMLGYNYAKHIFEVNGKTKTDFEKKQIELSLSASDDAAILYTIDGSNPDENSDLYSAPIIINESCTVKAIPIRNGKITDRLYEKSFNINKATFKKIELTHQPHRKYRSEESTILVDGLQSTNAFNSGEWSGFYENDLDIIIDLEETVEISKVEFGNYVSLYDQIFPSTGIQVYISDDKENFTKVYDEEISARPSEKDGNFTTFTATFEPVNTRYVKIVSNTVKSIPDWMTWRAGRKAFQFIDEIVVE